jgi:integrase
MTNKRANGEGSIYRKSDRLWCGQFVLPTGKRRTVYGKTRREVVQKLAELQCDPTTTAPGRSTLGQFMTRWFETASPSLRPTTCATYRSLIKCHVLPYVGDEQLTRVSPLTLEQLYADLEAKGVSPRMRQQVHALLHCALGKAVRLKLIRDNPASVVDRPRARRREIRALTADEVGVLLRAAEGDRLEALYVVAVTTGLRQGEIFALKWKDINLRQRVLSVRRALLDAGGHREIADPKTAKGKRRVELPDLAVKALKAHRGQLQVTPHPESWVFTDVRGGTLRRSNFIRRNWAPLLAHAGLDGVRFHDLRHTCASLLLAGGIHPKVVQERLGHATIAITLDTYSHVVGSLQRDAADRIDALLK